MKLKPNKNNYFLVVLLKVIELMHMALATV
jgi:hypothetical protein